MLSLHYYLSPDFSFFFFFNDTATTEIYTLSLHDALPISAWVGGLSRTSGARVRRCRRRRESSGPCRKWRSEEHTSELQSRLHLVCRLLLEKKKKHIKHPYSTLFTESISPKQRAYTLTSNY